MFGLVFYILNNFYFKKLMSVFLAVQNKLHLKNQIFPKFFFPQKLFWAKYWTEGKETNHSCARMDDSQHFPARG
jgi:hypothetical protein